MTRFCLLSCASFLHFSSALYQVRAAFWARDNFGLTVGHACVLGTYIPYCWQSVFNHELAEVEDGRIHLDGNCAVCVGLMILIAWHALFVIHAADTELHSTSFTALSDKLGNMTSLEDLFFACTHAVHVGLECWSLVTYWQTHSDVHFRQKRCRLSCEAAWKLDMAEDSSIGCDWYTCILGIMRV